MQQSTEQERAYFARIGRANAVLVDSRPPASLSESFERFAVLEQLHKAMAGQRQPNHALTDGDLASHLSYLARLRTRRPTHSVPLALADGNNST